MRQRAGIFDIANYLFLALVCFSTLYPFWTQLVTSFSTPAAYYGDWYHIVPRSFSLDNYRQVLQRSQVFISLANSVAVTAMGTIGALACTIMASYVLSKSHLRGRKFFFFLFVFSYFISGGLIPFYLVVTKLGLRNSLLGLVLPYLINVYFVVLMKNYFQGLPAELEESARLDGANDIVVLVRIVVPVAKPITATIGLFSAVQYWNAWFPAMIFLSSEKLFPLALYLRTFLSAASRLEATSQSAEVYVPGMMRAAIIMIAIVPIVVTYPFVQKYFVRGIMLGALKS